MTTLEQYFTDQPLLPEETADSGQGQQELSPVEQAFLRKYLGVGTTQAAPDIPSVQPEQVLAGTAQPEPTPSAPDTSQDSLTAPPSPVADMTSQREALRAQPILQLIGFRLESQDYALPIDVVQEVIRSVEATRLPSAPAFLSGVVNLRGKVTPLVSLRTLMHLPAGDDKFIIVCRHAGLQIGLQIQAVSTMHRVEQDRIDWGVESLLGVQNDMVAGLIRAENQRLIGILSLDHLVQSLLKT